MEKEEIKNERLSEDDLQHFCDTLVNSNSSSTTRCLFTVDYFDTCMGVSPGKEVPSILSFSVSLLHEILCNMKPGHELWDKIKYATFILYLTTRNIEFSILYDIFHQVEMEVQSKSLHWRDKQVQVSFEEKIVEKFIVKEDIANFSDLNESEDKSSLNPVPSLDPASNFDDENTTRDDYQDFSDVANKVLEGDQVEEKPKIKRKYSKRKKQTDDKDKRTKRRKPALEDDATEENFENENPDNETKITNGNHDSSSKSQRMKRKMRPGVIPCLSCEYKAKDNHDFDKHTFQEHEASRLCSQCGYLSTSFRDYTSHNQTHIYTCDICQEKKLGLKGFRKHMKSHEIREEKKVSEDTKNKQSRVPCDMCGVLLFENNLKQHVLTEHTNETHKCDLCDYTANTKLKVHTHRKSHFVKMSKCHECGKMVKDMRKHFLRNCAGKERERHFCHLCEKSFSLKEGLDRHIKHIHQKILNYHCSHCDYKTYAGFNLRLHVSKMHTKEDMEKICPYCSQKTNSLNYHIKIYHIEEQLKNQVNKEEPIKQSVDL